MQPRKVPTGRRPRRPTPAHGRTLRYRAPPPYVYPRRGAGAPADEDVAPERPPYVAIAVMAAVFLFLMFVILGGAQPDPRSVSKIEPISILRQR
jgi:hypothetical protein